MRLLLGAALMMMLHSPLTAETQAVKEVAARPTVLPRNTHGSGKWNSHLQCFVEVGNGVTVSYRPISVAPFKRRSECSMLITCDSMNTLQPDGAEMLIVCSGCKVDIGDTVATSPKATVDTDNNRLVLSGTDNTPVILTIGKGDNARTASAKELAIPINN